jgi:hydroxyacyl-ACP dehydratase HTD2-like protein with hotdog domain
MNNALCFEDVEVDQTLMRLKKGPMTTTHIMRWSSAIENWHRIHYDQRFAIDHDKLPDVLVNGSWKQHILAQVMKDGLGPNGWLWKIKFRYDEMNVAGDTIYAEATVKEKQVLGGLGFLTCRLFLTDQNDKVNTPGWAIGVLPLRDGRAVPYPFVVEPDYADLDLPKGR